MSDWQPIGTAPKDETEILGYDGTLFVCRWLPGLGYCANPSAETVWPTHWMPLPPEPYTPMNDPG